MNSVEGVIEKFDLPKLGQIGIVTADLETMLDYYAKMFQLNPWFRTKAEEEEIYYRGEKLT